MRIFILTVLTLVCLPCAYTQGVLISPNPGQPDPSAGLDVDFTNKGFLLPRLTTAQRNAIVNPAVGLEIYNTTTECIEGYFNSGWQPLGCACTTPPPAPTSINGPLHVCPSEAGVLFYTPVIPGAISYQWILGNSDVLVNGQGNDSIVVNFSGNHGNRIISVIASNTCGSSNAYSITVNASNPDSGFTFSQPVNINNPATFNATTPNLTYSWSFASGSPATASTQSVPVTWTNPGSYAVSLTVTDADGCTSTHNQNVTVVNCIPATYTFTNCGATGRFGPNQTQCNNTYGPGVVTSTNGIQKWVVPTSGNYQIYTAGAQGGSVSGGYTSGQGAKIQGIFSLTAGQEIWILVGQQGDPTGSNCGAGGGGTFVATGASYTSATPLIVAGGGGGASSYSGYNGRPAVTTPQATNCAGNSYGTIGQGGTGSSNGGNGGGYNSDGGSSYYCTTPAKGFVNGGAGGEYTGGSGVNGGFGGGGNSHSNCEPGGGGGYSGGSGEWSSICGYRLAGGGGSYIASSAGSVATSNGLYNNASIFNGSPVQNLSSFQSGNGSVVITRVCP